MRRLWSAGGTRIVHGMLGYVLMMAVLATLSPFDFQIVPGRRFALLFLADDVLLNLLLLFPAGFLFALGAQARRPAHALLLGLGLSAALETAQLFLPSRHANVVDVLGNGLGCWAGALAERRVGRWLAGFVSEELVLELPLTGALYVLVPLLMLLGLGSGDTARVWLLWPLAIFGATILAALYQQRFVRAGALSPERFAAYAALAFLGLVMPALLQRPVETIAVAACVALAIWIVIRRQVGWVPAQRRFEAATARRGLPWFALYLAALVATAWLEQRDGRASDLSGQRGAFRLLESVATLTVYGYLCSELASRTRRTLRALLASAAGSGLLLGGLTILPSTRAIASLLLCAAALSASAAAGAALHRAQVGLVQAMRAAGRSSGRPRV